MGFLKKVMIVDDNADIRHLLREYLTVIFGNRIVVREFASANDAKNFALNMDLIICDYDMQTGSGFDLYNYLNEQKQSHIPSMILFTGKADKLITSNSSFYMGQVDKTNMDELIRKVKLALDIK